MIRTELHPDAPDPDLHRLLDAGLDTTFERGRAKARRLLENAEGAFWLQVVGDGSTIHPDPPNDPVSLHLTHQLAFAAGYHDDHDFATVRAVAAELFAHHLGILTKPDSGDLSPTEILTTVTESVTTTAHYFYDHLPTKDAQFPRPGGPETQRALALELLDSESLTGFWLQVCEPLELHRYGPSPGTAADSPWRQDVMVAPIIEYVNGVPAALDLRTASQLAVQYRAQHLFVAACTADADIDRLCREAADRIIEQGWLYESIGPL